MARLEGLIKFNGALGELVAYQFNGKWVVRRKSSLDKKRVKSDPAFQNTRMASQEFGGASTIGKFLRDRWHPFLRKDKDTTLNYRLNQILYQWIRNGQGNKGTRSFQWSELQEGFQPLKLNQADSITNFLERLPQITRSGNLISLSLNTSLLNLPQTATHAQLNIHLLDLPEFTFNGKKYAPQSASSPLLTLSSDTLPVQNQLVWEENVNLSFDRSHAYALSLSFFQEVNAEFYALKSHPFSWQSIV